MSLPSKTGPVEPGLYPSSTLHGRVVHDMGRMIVSGEIAEGAFLPHEEALSRSCGVSRHAIREALKVLAAKGLVASRRRAGTRVVPRSGWNLLDPDVLAWHSPCEFRRWYYADVSELRQLIEPAAAALAALRADHALIERIGVALAAMRAATGDLDLWCGADAAFHVAVLTASRNSLIARLGALIEPLLKPSFRLQGIGARLDVAVEYHAVVYRAIVNGDAVLARKSIQEIIEAAATEVTTAEALDRAAS